MGDLFFNKIAGAVLAILLVIMGLRVLSEGLFHAEAPEEPAYPIDLSALEDGASGEDEEEGPVDFGALLAAADVSAGERVARRCQSCHTFEEGGANGTGPNLWDVMGRVVASVDGFNYSSAMEEYAEGGTRWLYQNMYDYLENPRQYVPGTAMSFAGLRQQEDRINIIAYMRTLSGDPLALPEPLPEETAAAESEAGEETAVAEGVEPATAEGDADAPALETPGGQLPIDEIAGEGETVSPGEADEADEPADENGSGGR